MSIKNSLTHTKRFKSILSAVHMVYRLVNSTYNVNELILRLTRLLCQFIKAHSSTIYLIDQKSRRITLKGIYNNKINILVTKKKSLARVSQDEQQVTQGYTICRKHILGIPLVTDDIMGGIIIRRRRSDPAFTEFDRAMLSVIVEQSVTAIRNLQLYEEQQKMILGSIEFIGKLLEKHGSAASATHSPVHFRIIKTIGEKLEMGEEGINRLYYASILHDAGAIDLPYNILAKSSQLTPDEFKIIRNHPSKSVELIKPVEFLKPILPIILYHHEKYDGTGYPSGLKKEQIPLGARIMSVVDAFEAMIRGRPYKRALSVDEAVNELSRNSGTQFDPKVVRAFVELSKQRKFRNYLQLSKG